MERHLFHKKENVFVATWKIPTLKKLSSSLQIWIFLVICHSIRAEKSSKLGENDL